MAKSSDIILGQHLIRKRICSLKQVNEAIQTQRRLREQGAIKSMGWVLLQKGVIDEPRLRAALAELGVLELECPACREVTGIASYNPTTEYRCPRCRALLSLADPASPPENPKSQVPVEDPEGEVPDTSANDPMVSKVIGGCQVLKKIARGGMGVVYKARQLNLGRTVAIKILSEDLSKDGTYVERFIQEARSAATLSHGNIVHINDVGEHNGIFYFIMEYIDGENLREVLQRSGKLTLSRVLEIGLQTAQALQHAHRRGIVHRDIKPENIMITREGVVKLADMGLAKRIGARHAKSITHAGSILGTPFYMAPEQARDFSRVDRRSDIYSLGVTLYKALTGKVPYDGRSPIEVMLKAIEGKHEPIEELRPDAQPEVVALIERMMDRDPERRFQDAGEVATAMLTLSRVIPAGQPA